MTIQETLNNLDKIEKNRTKNISFQYGNNQPNFSGETLNIYDYDGRNTELLKGDLNLVQFPNLRKITFVYNLRVNSLETIDISENTKLSKIVIGQNNQDNTLKNSDCVFLINNLIR